MERKSTKKEYIQDASARRVAYEKRVKNILKKTEQLSTLYGTKACAIIYGPDDQVPVVWPPNEEDARRTIFAFKSKLEEDQMKHQRNQDISLQQKVREAAEELMKMRIKNRIMEMENLITDVMTGKLTFEQVPPTDLGDLLWVLEDKLKTNEENIAITKMGGANKDSNLNVISTNDGQN